MSNKIELFAGLNGIDGYVPLLEYTLSPMKRVFILKGSPGSGKSTVMKRIAARAEAEGHPLTVIRCSSDPDSLDGVMLTDLGVAVADGTSPHSLDPKKYGIREVTVSLEDTFDYDRLGFFSGRLGRLFEKRQCTYVPRHPASPPSESWRMSGANTPTAHSLPESCTPSATAL